jgi:hypothetical protein
MGIVSKATEDDIYSIIDSDKKERLHYGRMWIKRMVNQAIRGSFECYINAGKDVTSLDHVAEINEDITNLDDSINMNLWALNEEMGFDMKIKEKVSVEGMKMVNYKLINPKHFIVLQDVDRDIVLERNIIRSINNIPETEESNIIIDPDPELKPGNGNIFVHVNNSYSDQASDGEFEKETVENNSIFYEDGAESE